MSLILNTTLGSYFPSFFILNLNCDHEKDDLNDLTDKPRSVFIHEYIHFLQDRSIQPETS